MENYWNNELPNEVLRMIFSYLNGKELAKVAMICSSWSEAAIQEQRIRKGPCCVKYNDNMTFEEYFNAIKNIRIKPIICIWFSSEFISPIEIERFINTLPKNCKIIILYRHKYLNKCRQICLFLSNNPNVKIEGFDLSEVDNIEYQQEYRDINFAISNHETSNHKTSYLMLFSNQLYRGSPWISAIRKSQNYKNFMICNNTYNNILLSQNWIHDVVDNFAISSTCTGVLITGLMKTYSVILEKDLKTEEQIETKVKLFKHQIKLKKNSIGFIFAGIQDNESRLKLQILERLFPEVPLIDSVVQEGSFRKTTDEANEEGK